MPVPGSPGIQELNPVDVDEIPEVLGIRLFVVPRLGASDPPRICGIMRSKEL